jgi:hypothetical protein
MKNIILSTFLLFIVGCSTIKVNEKQVIVLPGGTSMTECPELSKIEQSTFDAILKNHVDLLKQYKICRDDHRDLIDYVKKDKGLK